MPPLQIELLESHTCIQDSSVRIALASKKIPGFLKGENILSTPRVMDSFEPDCKHDKMVIGALRSFEDVIPITGAEHLEIQLCSLKSPSVLLSPF